MNAKIKKPYNTPKLTRLGSVENVTQALLWPGSGDILSGFTQDPDDDSGCGNTGYGIIDALCS